jgi:hypothetical protein
LWRIQRVLLDAMRAAIIGPITINDWIENANCLRRYLFNSPRRRSMQQADIYAAVLPIGLS